MLSKANAKYVKSLQVKKYRKQEQCFVVEGAKSVQELLRSDLDVLKVFATPRLISELGTNIKAAVIEVTESQLSALGEFQTNNTCLAVARMRENVFPTIGPSEFALVLDNIRDPGNLGTIIRIADWYGITKMIASTETADFYSPKVISATMGSFTRVRAFYTDLVDFLKRWDGTVFGAFLDGKSVHDADFGTGGLIVIGNESHGISAELLPFVTDKITIPRFGGAESLNAAVATAVICDNIRRAK